MKPPPEVLEDWLAARRPPEPARVLLDVGAYHGDFSRACRTRRVAGAIHLFEPNPANHPALEAFARAEPGVALHKIALGADDRECDFNASADAATGSVLPYRDAPAGSVRTTRVAQRKLDGWWIEHGRPAVGLLKIDTQGNDMAVLTGAAALVASQQPWIVAELIFVPLYEGQARVTDLLAWADQADYVVAALFNEHFTEAGLLAFADVVLLPRKDAPPATSRFVPRPATAALQAEVEALRGVCAERLALIERLHAEAEKRLQLVHELDRQLQARKQT